MLWSRPPRRHCMGCTALRNIETAHFETSYSNMKVIFAFICGMAACISASASVIPLATHVPAPTYAVAASPPVITAQSHQVVTRNHNRLYVPPTYYVSTTSAVPAIGAYAHASYAGVPTAAYRYGAYPYVYYPTYGYTYGTTAW